MSLTAIDRPLFFSSVRHEFGRLTQSQVDGIERLLSFIETDPYSFLIAAEPAYLLATAWHETAQAMRPIAEIGHVSYFHKYDPVLARTPYLRARAISMGNTHEGDGYKYRGRGYVQTTWRANYERLGAAVGVDLVQEPDRALEPAIAYVALSRGVRVGWYTGKRLGQYVRPGRIDYEGARRCVNGTDKAKQIAEYAYRFEHAIEMATDGE